jgi:outer membrane protein OmpA-like peptidoglycan-associated protein
MMKYLGFTLFLLVGNLLCAQNYHTLSQAKPGVRKIFEAAKQEALRNQMNSSIALLLKCLQKDSMLTDAWTLLGKVYYDTGDYQKALAAFNRLADLHPNYDVSLHYAFGLTAYKCGDYALAVHKLTRYLESGKFKGALQEQANRLLENALFSEEAVQHAVPFAPTPLNNLINTEAPEYLPSFSADDKTLLFTRVVRGQEDIYYTQRDEKTGDWQKPIALDQLNTPFNEGAHTLSADGSTLIFTQCEHPGSLGSCDLYISYKDGEQWTSPKNMGAPINSPYWESMPTLSANGNQLFFSTKRPGGFGGTDIWMSSKISPEKWSKPENLGPLINTPGDDQAPFLHVDGQSLYFMSRGHQGMGGFDLYLSRLDGNKNWGKPIHLGYPINTTADEGALCINRTGETAYFSSSRNDLSGLDRSGKSNIDIFSFPLYEEIRPVPVTFITGKIVAVESEAPLPAYLEINATTTDSIIYQTNLDASGSFFICLPSGEDYSFLANHPGYTLYSNHFTLSGSQSALNPHYLDIRLQKVHELNPPDKIETLNETGEAIILKNVFFETNSTLLSPDSQYELNKLVQWLSDNGTAFIQINGHTDNIGTEENNLILSTSRAQAVYHYLVNRGIDPRRLRYKGFGSGRPIADNATESGRKENRRTEFILLQ